MAGESALWDWLSSRLPVGGRFSRIESETSPGFPDVDYTFRGISGTIELKSAKNPKTLIPFRTGGLRQSQKDWIADELIAGGLVFIVARIEPYVYFFKGFEWYRLEEFEPSNPKHRKRYIRRFSIRPSEAFTIPDCKEFLTEMLLGMY